MTHALRMLDSHRVAYTRHEYRYVEHGGTAEAARQLGLDEHAVIKTLCMEPDPTDRRGSRTPSPLLMLMHGDLEVSAKALARALGVKSIAPCREAVAERVTGYQVGGISPFGTRQTLAVYVEASVLALPRVYVNGGRRGLLVGIEPSVLVTVLSAREVHARAQP